MGWANMRDRMLDRVVDTFADGSAQYIANQSGPISLPFKVILERNLERTGPDGVFLTDSVGITWRKPDLLTVERGGVLIIGAERFIVEEVISDDGYMMTAACMVQP
ncbi:head-tail joining protein [Azomonas macrocytogenes]|uniref:Uncharacterized protein n=1 Tax=Azomonas macrocytogenes TaxID=69962 RepID=A0A839T761_AZOMA|nr:hypothetical protein [Azomonas macrocytogenes]MBB3103795.1 hypothetical protein [Azomonas macrocytogenes]